MMLTARRTIIVFIMLLLLIIALLQFLRMDSLQRLFPAIAKPLQPIQTMTSNEKSSGAGEQLLVSIITDRVVTDAEVSSITQALSYAKIPFELRQSNQLASLQPSPYHIALIANDWSAEMPYDVVRNFVEQGGRLFVASTFYDPKWDELLGIASNQGFFKEPVHGLSFQHVVFPGYEAIGEEESFANGMLDVTLREQAKVYAVAENHPLLWTYEYGKGKVVCINATMLQLKFARGFFTHALGLASPAFVSSQAAIKVMFIDDFPAPVPSGTNEMLQRSYGLTIRDFYQDVWWEDMKKLAKKHNLLFTNVFIGTYSDKDEATAQNLIEQSRTQMQYYGRESIERGDELGYHGYNHQSLVTKDEPIDPAYKYIPWKSQEQMEVAINRAESMFHYYFPGYPLATYVPPSNAINETGTAALVKALPDLRTIAALYIGNIEQGAPSHEFAFDATHKNLYYLPRISSGYKQQSLQDFLLKDAIANFGVFNHFIHPDDILDEARAGTKDWEGLKNELDDLLTSIDQAYPYLKPYTAAQAREKLIQYEKSKLSVYYAEKTITISGTELVNPADVIVRLESGKKLHTGSFDGYTVRSLSASEPIYSVTLQKPLITLEIKEAT